MSGWGGVRRAVVDGNVVVAIKEVEHEPGVCHTIDTTE